MSETMYPWASAAESGPGVALGTTDKRKVRKYNDKVRLKSSDYETDDAAAATASATDVTGAATTRHGRIRRALRNQIPPGKKVKEHRDNGSRLVSQFSFSDYYNVVWDPEDLFTELVRKYKKKHPESADVSNDDVLASATFLSIIGRHLTAYPDFSKFKNLRSIVLGMHAGYDCWTQRGITRDPYRFGDQFHHLPLENLAFESSFNCRFGTELFAHPTLERLYIAGAEGDVIESPTVINRKLHTLTMFGKTSNTYSQNKDDITVFNFRFLKALTTLEIFCKGDHLFHSLESMPDHQRAAIRVFQIRMNVVNWWDSQPVCTPEEEDQGRKKHGAKVTRDITRMISGFNRTECLSLHDCGLTRIPGPVLHWGNLRVLDMSHSCFENLNTVHRFKNLEVLLIRNANVGQKQLVFPKEMNNHPKLRIIDAYETDLVFSPDIRELPALEELNVDGFSTIPTFVRDSKTLKKLVMERYSIPQVPIDIARIPTLEVLVINDDKFKIDPAFYRKSARKSARFFSRDGNSEVAGGECVSGECVSGERGKNSKSKKSSQIIIPKELQIPPLKELILFNHLLKMRLEVPMTLPNCKMNQSVLKLVSDYRDAQRMRTLIFCFEQLAVVDSLKKCGKEEMDDAKKVGAVEAGAGKAGAGEAEENDAKTIDVSEARDPLSIIYGLIKTTKDELYEQSIDRYSREEKEITFEVSSGVQTID